jgi:hypothetical protein
MVACRRPDPLSALAGWNRVLGTLHTTRVIAGRPVLRPPRPLNVSFTARRPRSRTAHCLPYRGPHRRCGTRRLELTGADRGPNAFTAIHPRQRPGSATHTPGTHAHSGCESRMQPMTCGDVPGTTGASRWLALASVWPGPPGRPIRATTRRPCCHWARGCSACKACPTPAAPTSTCSPPSAGSVANDLPSSRRCGAA